MWMWMCGLAWASPQVSQTEASGEHLRQLLASPDGAEWVLFHASEQRGELGACGCSAEPLGGLARVDRYIRETEKRSFGSHVVKLHLGHAFAHDRDWALGRMTSEARARNEAVTAALNLGGWDAVNLACDDAWAVMEGSPPSGLISTNMVVPGVDLVSHWRTEAAGVDVVVLGVTGPCRVGAAPLGVERHDPVEAVQRALATVEADVVVVVAYGLEGAMMAFAQLPRVDVVIEAGDYQARYRPQLAGELVWVRSAARTARLGELRLQLEGAEIHAIEDRRVRLGPSVRGTKAIEKLEQEVAVWTGAG